MIVSTACSLNDAVAQKEGICFEAHYGKIQCLVSPVHLWVWFISLMVHGCHKGPKGINERVGLPLHTLSGFIDFDSCVDFDFSAGYGSFFVDYGFVFGCGSSCD